MTTTQMDAARALAARYGAVAVTPMGILRIPRREVRIRKIAGRWCWVCTLCHPAVHGATRSWPKTMRHVARHCTRTRRQHHAWVARHHGRWL